MRMFKVIGLAVVACMALAAAATSASAAEIVVTTGQELPQLFLGAGSTTSKLRSISGSGTVESTIECPSVLIHGLLNSPHDLLILLLFHKCTTQLPIGATANCQTPGEPAGLIHTVVLALPVWLNAAKTLPGLLIEKDPSVAGSLITEFECKNEFLAPKIGVKGTVLGKILKPLAKTKSNSMELAIETVEEGKKQRFTKVEEGSIVDELESDSEGAAFKKATEEVLPTLTHFNTGVEAEFR